MRVQGKHQKEEFFRRALLPYLKREITSHATQIGEINLHFQQLGSSVGSRTRGNKTGPKSKPGPPNKRSNFKLSKITAEQQLEESDLESTEGDNSIISVRSYNQEGQNLNIEKLKSSSRYPR